MSPQKDLFAFEDEPTVIHEFAIGDNAKFKLLENTHVDYDDGSATISYKIESYLRENAKLDFADTPIRDTTLHVDFKEVAIAEKARELFSERNEVTIDVDQLEEHREMKRDFPKEFKDDLTAAKAWVLNNRFPVEKRMRELEQKLEKETLAERQQESEGIRIRKPKL
ncbi:hypothetical protein Enr13x_38120 [Stieleria neptunia]|uniref:Uncharacterized protein n=1 Tax=Stieleria neptunia TaxID=2527979 RepID=A0A518HSY3_9BACT|nr:hypothetical protein [Stieleria neptunia]QDV43952.1 hypothetical protein Enr13x_38120 [Stieleria neptunia]